MNKVKVRLSRRSYPIVICDDKFRSLGSLLEGLNLGSDAVIITNPVLKKLFAEELKASLEASGFSVKIEEDPDSETSKSNQHFNYLLTSIATYDTESKRIFIVALGGGVIGDLAGFVAAAYKRGVPLVQVPTTLLAQVDSSIGGKTGIDLPQGKNLAGAFYQPRLVYSDLSVLEKLPLREIRCGMAEVIKYGVILDRKLFEFLEQNYFKIFEIDKGCLEYIVHTCARLKARIVAKDELEKRGIRTILNFGHTLGHAIEAACGYANIYTHGEAIAVGMLCAADIACKLKIFDDGGVQRIKSLIKKFGLPTRLTHLKLQQIMEAQSRDKKFVHGRNRFVLPVRIGRVVIRENIPRDLVSEVLEKVIGS